jgi:hypothetical protein
MNPGEVVDREAGEVAISASDRDVISLEQDGDRPNLLLKVRPVKRRQSTQIRKWLAFMQDKVNRHNAGAYQEQVFRCADEFAQILREHLVGWADAYDGAGRPIAFSDDAFDDVLDDGQVMIAVAELYALSMAGSMAKKPVASPLRLSTPDGAGSSRGTETDQGSGPMSTRSGLHASIAGDATPAGFVGLSEVDGTKPASSQASETTNPPPPPLRPASG